MSKKADAETVSAHIS